MPSDESEKKGRIYEAFVKLAYEKKYNRIILWEPDIPGVIANQDIVYPTTQSPETVIAVTYWGSHETANKKFWRTVEDRYEIYCAFPEAAFLSIVFEINAGSDAALDEILSDLCFGRALSERTSSSLSNLQKYVDSDEKVRSFGRGKDAVYASCVHLYTNDSIFRQLIDNLGEEINGKLSNGISDFEWCKQYLDKEAELRSNRTSAIGISGYRHTFYKKGLIQLLRFSNEEIALVLRLIEENKLSQLAEPLKDRLKEAKLITERTIGHTIVPSDELSSIATIGGSGYSSLSAQIAELVEIPTDLTDLWHYKDHYRDITDSNRRRSLFSHFQTIQTAEDILQSIHGVGDIHTQRIWIVDYYLAIKRVLTKGKYGFKKLSQELDLPYIGGISPLPQFVAGKDDEITSEKQQQLFEKIAEEILRIDFSSLSDQVIVHDRSVTLMKKFNILELLVINALLKAEIPEYMIHRNHDLKNILVRDRNARAGTTEMNFVVAQGNRAAQIFIVSAYDASHKHKEVSGRARMFKQSADLQYGEYTNIIVLDGTLLDETPEKKLKMMYESGWDAVYFADELDSMAQRIKAFLSCE